MKLTDSQILKLKDDGMTAWAVAEQLGIKHKEAVKLLKEAGAKNSGVRWVIPMVGRVLKSVQKFSNPTQWEGDCGFADGVVKDHRRSLNGGFRMKEKS